MRHYQITHLVFLILTSGCALRISEINSEESSHSHRMAFENMDEEALESDGENLSMIAAVTPGIEFDYNTDRLLERFRSEWQHPPIWSESKILEAFVEMYKATKDTQYLDSLVKHADELLSMRDDKTGRVDITNNRPMPGWGTDKYSCGKRYVDVVHVAVLTYPMLFFAKVVEANQELHTRFGEKAKHYIAETIASLSTFDSEFRTIGDEGFYFFPERYRKLGVCGNKNYPAWAGDERPFNYSLAIGRVHLRLYQLTHDNAHLIRAERIARRFKQFLRVSNGAYVWVYWVGGRVEDTSHGGLDIQFVKLASKMGVVFMETDLTRFANTFITNIARNPERLCTHVDGERRGTANYNTACERWLDLAGVDERVYRICRNIIIDLEGDTPLGMAKLLKWERKL